MPDEKNEDVELQEKIQDGDAPPDIEQIDLSQSDLFTEKTVEEKVEKPKKEKEPPQVIEGDKDTLIRSMQSRLDEQEKSLRRLHYEERHKKKEEKTEQPTLTDEQLLKFMEDAGNDKASMLRVMKYAAEQAAKGAKVSALSEADMLSKKREVEKNLKNVFKDKWDDPTSEVRTELSNIKSEFSIDDNHPYSDLFGVAVGIMKNLPNIQKAAFEAGKAEATKGLSEEERQKNIDQNKLGGGIKKGGGGNGKGKSGLTPAQEDIAKKLGYGIGNPKKPLERYASILKTQGMEA
jgi:hypothetical protein